MSNKSWLDKAKLKAKVKAKNALLQEYAVALSPAEYAGTGEELALLPSWHRTATAKAAISVSPTGAAILPKSMVGHEALPRVLGWRKILKEIGKANGDASRVAKGFYGQVADFLYDVEFQHHRSTNGRWNSILARWERYGVRSVEDWRYGKAVTKNDKAFHELVPERTFHRFKRKLIDLGLIDASSHLWQGRNCLWVRPTDELSRILFETGYWDKVRAKYAPTQQEKVKPPLGNRPRGISARHKSLDAELMALYRKSIVPAVVLLPKEEAWAVWNQLTKPIPLGPIYNKAPFLTKGSYKYKRLHEALGLAYL